jgi:hypothetical protein
MWHHIFVKAAPSINAYGSLHGTATTSERSSGTMIGEQWVQMDVHESGCGLIWGTISASAQRDCEENHGPPDRIARVQSETSACNILQQMLPTQPWENIMVIGATCSMHGHPTQTGLWNYSFLHREGCGTHTSMLGGLRNGPPPMGREREGVWNRHTSTQGRLQNGISIAQRESCGTGIPPHS